MIFHKDFESVQAFADYLERASDKNWGDFCSSHNPGGPGLFRITPDFETAQEMMRTGAGMALPENFNRKINASGQKRQVYLSVVGAGACVPAYVAGLPTSMVAARRVPVPVKFAKIVIFPTLTFCESSAALLDAFTAMFAEIISAEKSGIRCEIWTYFGAQNKTQKEHNKISYRVKIKGFQEALNISRSIYLCCHPDATRRQMFRFIECSGATCEDFESYGCRFPYDAKPGEISIETPEILGKSKEEIHNIFINKLNNKTK